MQRTRFPSTHTLLLISALFFGLLLRLLNLAGKPLWMDEVITTLFSFGLTYDDIPLERVMGLAELTKFLAFRPEATCAEITTNVMTQSVHPPLFFCGLHQWLSWLRPISWQPWIWKLRAFSVLFGVGSIGLAYGIGRMAFHSRRVGLLSAWIMAVSPFTVYLSQEARHYTLPMFIVMLGLLGLVKIQQDWLRGKINPLVWVGWAICQTVGFYTHYFFLLATIAQVGALLLWVCLYNWFLPQQSQQLSKPQPIAQKLFWVPVALTVAAIGFTYRPWLPIFISHITRPETNWMRPFQPNLLTALAPLWQMPIGWLSMIVAFPVENQPLWVLLPTAIGMVLFGLWMMQQVWQGFRQAPSVRPSIFLLAGFLAIVILEFLAIIFVLQKDITQVPRYNFIYYPAICILLAAGLNGYDRKIAMHHQPWFYLILMGGLSSLFINANLVFQKPFQPERMAENIALNQPKITVVMGYVDYQELAMGLSFALALQDVNPNIKFGFFNRSMGYDTIFQQFSSLPSTNDFWLIAPGLRQREFPNLALVGQKTCRRLGDRYYRIGIPYQGYQCK